MKAKLLMPLVAVLLAGCTDMLGQDVIHGGGRYVEEGRAVGRFAGVSNATVATVDILLAPVERLTIRGEENMVDEIRTRVDNGILRIYTDHNVILRPNEPLVIEVDAVTLEWLLNSGSGDIVAPVVDAGRLDVVASGSGGVFLEDLLAEELFVTSSGSGDVLATGEVSEVRITHSGSGQVDTRDLFASEVDATLSGSGTSTVRARDWIYAVIAGSGSLRYFGNPVVQHTTTGSGRVLRVGN
jgi:hypothetical protein